MVARKRPGGEIARRPLHFIWIADCSGSMSVDGKIQALNTAIREAIPHMRRVAEDNPYADVLVRAVKFSHGAGWHVAQPTNVNRMEWRDLAADPLQQSGLKADIVFMVDTSGSMSDEIEAVKSSCLSFAGRIAEKGATVRLGLVGFDIGGHQGRAEQSYKVYDLSTYTIGVWPLASASQFKQDVRSLELCLFGGGGCYLADRDTTDIFPHVARVFGATENRKILVVISDEIGDTGGLEAIVSCLKNASIQAHVLGVSRRNGAHQLLADRTGGQFWDIKKCKGSHDFSGLLETVAAAIAKEISMKLSDGTTSAGTDLGSALRMVGQELRIPPMSERALPPVLVLVSDGRPTDDYEAGLKALWEQPWGKKAVRIAIGIGRDADRPVLQKFIGNPEFKPLQADNPAALVEYIKWASTAVVKSASAPVSQFAEGPSAETGVPIPPLPEVEGKGTNSDQIW